MESRAVASHGTGGVIEASQEASCLSLSKKGWVGCKLEEEGEDQAGLGACWGRQATARPVIPKVNSHWSILQTGHSQTSLSARSHENHTTAKVNISWDPMVQHDLQQYWVVKATMVSGSPAFLQGAVRARKRHQEEC